MSFVTGLQLIDAPASALNNQGAIPGERDENTVGVKSIRTKEGAYPYVSAQAFRYWLRSTLETTAPEWKAAPIFREKKIAYTDANPIKWWDDDLFGYMRAPSKRADAVEAREADEARVDETPTTDTITRVSPFRVSTLVSIAPVMLTQDFGVMSRQEGMPVPHEHQFYRTTLLGLFSLDLRAAGTFSYRQRTGFRNLDDVRIELAKQEGLEHLESQKSYRLSLSQRVDRIGTLFEGLSQLDGGAKQALHYTDVTPDVVVMAVTKGGNHIFAHIFGSNNLGGPVLSIEALQEALTVFKNELLSPVYFGWVKGFLDSERTKLEEFIKTEGASAVRLGHPREVFQEFVADMRLEANASWLD